MPENQSKPKSVVLELPQVHRIGGDVNAMLDQTVAERFKSILLVPTGKEETSKDIKVVLSHMPDPKDPKVQISTWNAGLGHVLRFMQACVDAYASGIGLSGDGSCRYVNANADTVLKLIPNIQSYDLFLVPNGRSGVAKYRIAMTELIKQVRARAKVIETCADKYGISAGKERTKKSTSVPEVTVTL